MATDRQRKRAHELARDHTFTNGRYTPPPVVLRAGRVREPVGGSVLVAMTAPKVAKKP